MWARMASAFAGSSSAWPTGASYSSMSTTTCPSASAASCRMALLKFVSGPAFGSYV